MRLDLDLGRVDAPINWMCTRGPVSKEHGLRYAIVGNYSMWRSGWCPKCLVSDVNEYGYRTFANTLSMRIDAFYRYPLFIPHNFDFITRRNILFLVRALMPGIEVIGSL